MVSDDTKKASALCLQSAMCWRKGPFRTMASRTVSTNIHSMCSMMDAHATDFHR